MIYKIEKRVLYPLMEFLKVSHFLSSYLFRSF